MDSKKIKSLANYLAPNLAIGVVALIFVVLPASLTVLGGLLSDPRPSGFGQNIDVLGQLILTSLITSAIPAAAALLITLIASSLALGSRKYRLVYRGWLVIMLFTNPIFLVLGFSSILTHITPIFAVIIATTYIVLPLGGLIIQSSFDQYSLIELYAARSLGAKLSVIIFSNILPQIRGQIGLAMLLMTIYALGFYLLPTYVGFGWVVTLGTGINTTANRLGDWSAAQQLSCVMLLLQFLLMLIWWSLRKIFVKRGSL